MASPADDSLTQPLAGQPAGQGSAPGSPGPTRGWWQQIGAWGLANAMNQHIALTNARVSKLTGGPVEPIPFGNNTIINQAQAPGQPAAPASSMSPLKSALLGTALGGGLLAAGLGLAKALMPAAAPLPAVPVINGPPPAAPVDTVVPLIIDWELQNAGPDDGTSGAKPTAP
jgi:hypothetical protein